MIELKTSIKEVSKIFHISDVHIRNYRRRDEYMKVFLNLREYILQNKTDNSIIFLGGDVVHSKLDMSPELVDMVSKLLVMLANISPLLIILGNHDANGKATNRMDALSPIVNALNHPNIYYLKENGYYKFAQIGFNVMEVFSDPAEYKKASGLDTKLKIALFHGMVDNASSDSGMKFSNAKITTETFNGHDLALLGDIHSRQFLQHYEEEEIEVDEDEVENYLANGWEASK